MNILFFDGVAPKPYTSLSLTTQPMGGTEATVIRVADALAKKHEVYVALLKAEVRTRIEGCAHYGPLEKADFTPDVVVCLREPGYLKDLRESYPNAKLYLWCHDLAGTHMSNYAYSIHNANATIVAVSHWHADQIQANFRAGGLDWGRPKYVYNPLDESIERSKKPYDPFKLAFMSSPHKGLDRTLEVFSELRRVDARYVMHVANPGYYPDRQVSLEGIVNHGSLVHKDLMEMVSDCVAVLHCNTAFPETFGIVHAEANALGVPFLTDFNNGAVQELMDHPQEQIDTTDTQAVVDRIRSWSEGRRPKVCGNPLFKLSRVAEAWDALFSARS